MPKKKRKSKSTAAPDEPKVTLCVTNPTTAVPNRRAEICMEVDGSKKHVCTLWEHRWGESFHEDAKWIKASIVEQKLALPEAKKLKGQLEEQFAAAGA